MKKINYLIGLLGFLTMFSCLNSDPIPLNTEAQLIKFALMGFDTVNYRFHIDEVSGLISNEAYPLPYETDVTAMKATYWVSPGAFVQAKDSVTYELVDTTINYSFQSNGTSLNDFSGEVLYKITSQDGVKEKIYSVRVHVATINPDEMIFEELNANVFSNGATAIQDVVYFADKFWYYQTDLSGSAFNISSSSTGQSWTAHTTSFSPGGHFRVEVLGEKLILFTADNLYESTDGVNWTSWTNDMDFTTPKTPLYTFLNGGELYRVGGLLVDGSLSASVEKSADAISWEVFDNLSAVQVIGAAATVHQGKMCLFGGKRSGEVCNELYISENGWHWVNIENNLPPLVDAVAFSYDDKLWVVGGFYDDDTANDKVYFSRNGGLIWHEDEDSEFSLPVIANRGAMHSYVRGNDLYFFGGYSLPRPETYHSDVYMGSMNKFAE